ncbi:MAG: zinc ribbon domain-containing protein [Candidatus Eremiobacterota bacterium]
MVKCTKCYAINKPEAKFCGSCGQTLVQAGQRTGQNTPSRPVYTPPVRPAYTPPVRDFSGKSSYNLPARVNPPSMPSRITTPAPSLPELKKKWSTDDEEEDFALAAINESENDNFAAPSDTRDSYAVEVVEENDNDAYHLTEDFKKEVFTSDVRDERPVEDTKDSDINILSRLFSGDRNLMDMFIIQEIMTPPRFKRRK